MSYLIVFVLGAAGGAVAVWLKKDAIKVWIAATF